MKEAFLHYLWQFQLFDSADLKTSKGEGLTILHPGYLDADRPGPDFTEAKIQIGNTTWAGAVEIHLRASDWFLHSHETDDAYDKVILHVVWEDDIDVFRSNNTPVSSLSLKGRVPRKMLTNYQNLTTNNKTFIACEKSFPELDDFSWTHFKENLFIERLQEKSNPIFELLEKTNQDWESVLYVMLVRNFGLTKNASAFEKLAVQLDFSIVLKERHEVKNLEALFMGQAGLLDEPKMDVYFKELGEIYKYQQHKYSLKQPILELQFFRLRPPNFPTVRLAQLAALFAQHERLFESLMQAKKTSDYVEIFHVKVSEYWQTHYVFDKESRKSTKGLSASFVDIILINLIIPLKFSYARYLGREVEEELFTFLHSIKAEKNKIIESYSNLNVKSESAFDTQALLQLYKNYCKPQRCLVCTIGNKVLKE